MANLPTFKYKNTPVYVRSCHYGNMPSKLQRTCFCCLEKVNNCMAVLLINNYKEIPNVILHDECYERWKDKTDELCDDIAKAYDEYKKLNGIFGSWITEDD